jgi:broad specificity phosphatase PhoE
MILFVTHPEVVVDPAVPVTRWGLSDVGRRRMDAFAALPLLRRVDRLFCSNETKATEAAHLLGARLGVGVSRIAALGENDRSATGVLPRDQFERAADAFFARPDDSYRGWERARDAQARIVDAVAQVLRQRGDGDTVIVSHGAVGTLYKCHLKGIPITRAEDQPSQGHYYAFEPDGRLQHDWRRIAD